MLGNDNPPIVHSVGLGNVNGITLGFSDAAPNQASNAGARRAPSLRTRPTFRAETWSPLARR